MIADGSGPAWRSCPWMGSPGREPGGCRSQGPALTPAATHATTAITTESRSGGCRGTMGQVDDRTAYVVEEDIVDRERAVLACTAVLEVLRPAMRSAIIDAYSDDADMPSAARDAEMQLRDHGARQPGRDPAMGVEVELDDAGWRSLLAYAPWSINVELIGIDGSQLGTLHDCGRSISAELTEEEAGILRRRLAGISSVVPLRDQRELLRQQRRDSRRTRWSARRRRRHPTD